MSLCGVHRLDEADYCPFCKLSQARDQLDEALRRLGVEYERNNKLTSELAMDKAETVRFIVAANERANERDEERNIAARLREALQFIRSVEPDSRAGQIANAVLEVKL